VAESEERLRLATEAADMFAWEIDMVSNTLSWAPNSARVIGCLPEQLSSDPAQGAFFAAAEDRLRMMNEFDAAIARGESNYSLQFRGIPGDDSRIFWQVHGTLLRNEHGKVVRTIGATQNITARTNAENAMRIIAERLATAEEAAGALIYDWDVTAQKVWRSTGLTRILGWHPDDISPDMAGWAALRHPEDESRLKSLNYADYLQADDHFILEYRVRHKAGHYVWVLDSGRVYRDVSGAVVRVAGATIDITARKEIEASRNRQANLIDMSFEPIFVWHPVKGIVDWNRGAEVLYGHSRTEAIGQQSHELLKTRSQIPLEERMTILKSEKEWMGELEHRAKDGRQILVESRHQRFESNGEILVLETNHDVSQRKRAETYTARMAAVAASSHDALFGITLDGFIETWNPAAERLFGYSESEAIGSHVRILAEPAKHDEQRDLMRMAQANETVGPYDARRLRKDGTTVDVSVALAPVKAPDGTLLAISVAVHDISDRKEWEAKQKLMTRELSHRIKNSFAVLQGILRSTLRLTPEPNAFAEAFSGRLNSLAAAQDVLTANDWKGAELGALARHQLAAYGPNEDNRVEFVGPEVNLPPDYAAPFGLMFNELATNAVKYGALSVPEGTILIMWRTERNPDASIRLFITWRETGGPKIVTRGRRGFGSTLIEKSLAGATVDCQFETEGLTCKIELTLKPVKRLRAKQKLKAQRQ
jgi:PAS domain S-box-containing protein